jgi:amino acid transporter
LKFLDLLLGRRLANRELGEKRIGAFEGVPTMGLDGLGSSSYGPEAALAVLAVAGSASLGYLGWVMAPIVALLLILFLSYWQTVRAYPTNGGAYIVARENLGAGSSLVAAAALMIDYVLNVAVGISAGVAALVSAVPALHPYMLPLCLGFLWLITLVNLRGTLDAGRLFALPTYVFVASLAAIVGIGLWRTLLSGDPHPVVEPPSLPARGDAITLWLLLRAFAAGCTAMTGVEAVSNGMGAFREPVVRHGHRTLAAICLILGLFLVGITVLATTFRIGAMDQSQAGYRSVLSQLTASVVGEGVFYYVAMGSLLCVLVLSADTSFTAFPRLCRMVAEDGYLPKPFAVAGHRLVFSVGILYLAATASLLMIAFGGITDHLIPLFAIGAFLTFTISQGGMALHWRRAATRSAVTFYFWVNAIGCGTTGLAFLVISVAKFADGAWITLIAVPAVVVMLYAIRTYYAAIEARVGDPDPIDFRDTDPPIVLLTMEDWNRASARALRFALTLSPDVVAVHLSQLAGPDAEDRGRTLREQWRHDVEQPALEASVTPPRLVLLVAQYRRIHEPLLKLIDELGKRFVGRDIAVLVPEIVKQRWYQHLLHTHRARRLRDRLLKNGRGRLIIVNVPWYLENPRRS